MKFKKYKKKKISNYFTLMIIVVGLSLAFSLLIINYLSKKTYEVLYPMAVSKTRKIVTMIINSACDDVVIVNDLYHMVKDNNDEIKMINYDIKEVTRIINLITYNIENRIKDIEKGNLEYYDICDGIIAKIPFGIVFGVPFLSNAGPIISVRLNLIGDIMSNLETEVKPYGINNAYVEVRVNLTVTARIVLPFISDEVVISNVIPISMNVVSGNVPAGYITQYK